MKKVLVLATSAMTRGGITSVILAHKATDVWNEFGCRWIETHRDGPAIRKIWYFLKSYPVFLVLAPFYDIIHIHVAAPVSAIRKSLYIAYARMIGKKIIVHFHPDTEDILLNRRNRWLYRYVFGSADRILVLSPMWKRLIETTISPRGVTEVLYNPCPANRRLDIDKEKHILFAGSIIRRKGYDTLIKGFAGIAPRYPEWKLVIAGNGETERARSLVRSEGIESRVEFTGWVRGIEKDLVFNRSSIYCLASTSEGFPMAMLDAWAYGLPSIVTPVGGIPDIVDHCRNGMVFRPGHHEELSDCIERLITDTELRDSIVRRQDDYVNGEFSLSATGRRLRIIYNEI